MFASENTFDEQSGLLRSGKRYKRDFGSYSQGQHTKYSPINPTNIEPEETHYVGNPPITLQRRPTIPEDPSQSESHPSPSTLVAGHSTPTSSPSPTSSAPPTPPRSTMAHMHDDIKLPVFKGSRTVLVFM